MRKEFNIRSLWTLILVIIISGCSVKPDPGRESFRAGEPTGGSGDQSQDQSQSQGGTTTSENGTGEEMTVPVPPPEEVKDPEPDPVQGDTPDFKLTAGTGVKSFEMINNTMSILTGIPTTNALIAQAYSDVKTQLPSTLDLNSFLGSHQVAISKLALEYCDAMVESASARALIFPDYGFDQIASIALDGNGRAYVAGQLVGHFYGLSGVSSEIQVFAQTEMLSLINDITTGKPDTVDTSKNVVKGACNAILASAPIVLL